MALNAIVEDIMKDEREWQVSQGSSISCVGLYIVQSLTTNGIQCSLPTVSVFIESREILNKLEMTTLKMLSSASGHKYPEQDILWKISFVMTDSTSHNLKVIKSVCKVLEVEKFPGMLLSNIHPLSMFQGKIKELCQDVQNTLRNKRNQWLLPSSCRI